MNEIELLNKILPGFKQGPEVVVGPGDDCAVLSLGDDALLLVAVDQLAAGVHYPPETAPRRIAAKLLKRNLSDIAAMGGRGVWALPTLASNRQDAAWYEEFYAGLRLEAERWGVSICGGDLGSLPPGELSAVASLTILGKIKPENLCLRSAAAAGEILYATGEFGNSLASEHHLDFTPRLAEGEFLAAGYARAMIDVSDGLLLDAFRVSAASGVGIILFPDKLPLRSGAGLEQALGDGEDYELLFSVPPQNAAELEKNWPFDTLLHAIGSFSAEKPPGVFDTSGSNLLALHKAGYEHTAN